MYLDLFRRGWEDMNGTKGKVATHPIGRDEDEGAVEEINSHVQDKRFAVVKDAISFPLKNSSCNGKRMERDSVTNCNKAMTGQTMKTKDAGVTRVGNI
jgi:hypothetical protein